MKVTINENYLEIQSDEEHPILCIDKVIAGYLLYELFSNGIEIMEKQYNILMELLKEEEGD